jgi:nucleotide-binding universal stress UspA family protein
VPGVTAVDAGHDVDGGRFSWWERGSAMKLDQLGQCFERIGERPVVVGIDGSPEAAGALRFAADHAVATSSGLLIVTATGEQVSAGNGSDRALVAARKVADEGREAICRTHPQLGVVAVVEHGPAERALVAASAAAGLVVGTRGRGALRGMLLGSVSQAVIDGARCPVAVIGADPLPRREDGTGIGRVAADRELVPAGTDVVEIWGHGSFPASDPPANW